MAVKTLDGRVLLGWMSREQGIRFLQEDCHFDPPLSADKAADIWEDYNGRIAALPARTVEAVARLPLDSHEKSAVADFRRLYPVAPNIIGIIKIDPMKLLAWQLYVVTELSDGYTEKVKGRGWLAECLLGVRPNHQLPISFDGTTLAFNLPHGEFGFGLESDGRFGIQQGARFVNVAEIRGRMLLATGYHRTFAFSRNAINVPDAIGRSVVVVLTSNLPFPDAPTSPNQGLRDMLLGARPPFFADFFDDRLFMSVKLLKKRYELRVNVQLVGVNES